MLTDGQAYDRLREALGWLPIDRVRELDAWCVKDRGAEIASVLHLAIRQAIDDKRPSEAAPIS